MTFLAVCVLVAVLALIVGTFLRVLSAFVRTIRGRR
jgi:hypothetical protein